MLILKAISSAEQQSRSPCEEYEELGIEVGSGLKLRDLLVYEKIFEPERDDELFHINAYNDLFWDEEHHNRRYPLQPIEGPTLRAPVIYFLHSTCNKLNIEDDIYHLSVYLFDRYMQEYTNINYGSQINKMKLIALTSLVIALNSAGKKDFNILLLVAATNSKYPMHRIVKMKLKIMMRMPWGLNRPTPLKFLRYLAKVGAVAKHVYFTAKYLLDLSIVHSNLVQTPPSKLAAAALFTAMNIFTKLCLCCEQNLNKALWSKALTRYSHYFPKELCILAKEMIILTSFKTIMNKSVYCKYSRANYDRIAARRNIFKEFLKGAKTHKCFNDIKCELYIKPKSQESPLREDEISSTDSD